MKQKQKLMLESVIKEILTEDDLARGGPNEHAEKAAVWALDKAKEFVMRGNYEQASKLAERAAFILHSIENKASF